MSDARVISDPEEITEIADELTQPEVCELDDVRTVEVLRRAEEADIEYEREGSQRWTFLPSHDETTDSGIGTTDESPDRDFGRITETPVTAVQQLLQLVGLATVLFLLIQTILSTVEWFGIRPLIGAIEVILLSCIGSLVAAAIIKYQASLRNLMKNR